METTRAAASFGCFAEVFSAPGGNGPSNDFCETLLSALFTVQFRATNKITSKGTAHLSEAMIVNAQLLQ